MALSNDGDVRKVQIESDRSFELNLPGGNAYTLNFLKNGRFVAVLFFQEKK